MEQRRLLVTALIICNCIVASFSLEVPGSLSLESMTFDKVVEAFTATLVKFDKAYAYGDPQNEFEIVAKLCAKNKGLAVAEVAINEYGEKENQDLAERYNIKADDYPQYRLFKGKSQDPVIHDGEPNHFEVIQFLRTNGIYVAFDGCSEQLDEFAVRFMAAAGDEEARNAVLHDLQEKSGTFSAEEEEKAKTYMSLMKNIIGKDKDFIQKSIDRVTAIINDGKLADNKKEALKGKVSVLKCFLLSAIATDPEISDAKISDPESAGIRAQEEL